MTFLPRLALPKRHHFRYKLTVLLLALVSATGLIFNFYTYRKSPAIGGHCFTDRHFSNDSHSVKLEDVLLSKKRPTPGKSVFFHETSCYTDGQIQLNARQACAIESAALMNPNFDIFLLFASPTFRTNASSLPLIDALQSYPNVHLRNVNLWTYAAGTPVYEWLKDGQLFTSKYVLSHTSDFLRYLTLWRWGGTYLDLDVIVKQNLSAIAPNYAGAESDNFIAAGIINLEADGFGHTLADMCLRNFQTRFDGSDWGNNGPGVITRVLHDVCKTKSPGLMDRSRCMGFKVFPKSAFYAVRWVHWKQFFQEKHFDKTMDATKESVIVHVWNKHSKGFKVRVGSRVAYGVLAEKYCPKVYRSCGEYF